MTWNPNSATADEASKCRWELVPYFHGRMLDIGCGRFKVFPHAIGIDNGKEWGKHPYIIDTDASDLSLFSTGSCDCVFSSHMLEHIPYEDVPKVLSEWCRVVKNGGHVILYLPDENQYPKAGTTGANPDHQWDVSYEKVVSAMESIGLGWDLVDYQVRSENDECSLFFVFKIQQGKPHTFSWREPKPEKTCAIVRYGAIGDMIQASSLLPWLKEQGYHITVYCQDNDGYQVMKHDPHVDRFIVQGRDEVPPQFLEEFWNETKTKYNKWVNLCESVEATLLAAPGRPNWWWPNDLRAKFMDRNYLEFTHELAGVPPPYRPKFYATTEERVWAKEKARSYGARNILWSLSGSSGHKRWPHLDAVVAAVMVSYPDTHIVMVGDEACQILEMGWEKERRVHRMSGKWTIRQSLAFMEYADLIIGCETGLLNAAGHMDVPKIITLSHSSPEMLTRHWKNTIALQQPKGVGCPKSPCRQLHGGNGANAWDDCLQEPETGTALCQFSIGPSEMFKAIQYCFDGDVRKTA